MTHSFPLSFSRSPAAGHYQWESAREWELNYLNYIFLFPMIDFLQFNDNCTVCSGAPPGARSQVAKYVYSHTARYSIALPFIDAR